MESESGRFRAVKELIGFNLVALAISALIVWLTCLEFSTKDKLIFVMQEAIFLGVLSVGAYLLING